MGAFSNGITDSRFSGHHVIYSGIAGSPTEVGNKLVHTHSEGDGGETLNSDPITFHKVTNKKGITKVYADEGDGIFNKSDDILIGKSSRGPLHAGGGTNGGVSFHVYYSNSQTGVTCVMCYIDDRGFEASARRSAKSSDSDDFDSMAQKGVGVITDLETGIQKIVNFKPLFKGLKAVTGSKKLDLACSDEDASFGSIVSQLLPTSDCI